MPGDAWREPWDELLVRALSIGQRFFDSFARNLHVEILRIHETKRCGEIDGVGLRLRMRASRHERKQCDCGACKELTASGASHCVLPMLTGWPSVSVCLPTRITGWPACTPSTISTLMPSLKPV